MANSLRPASYFSDFILLFYQNSYTLYIINSNSNFHYFYFGLIPKNYIYLLRIEIVLYLFLELITET